MSALPNSLSERPVTLDDIREAFLTTFHEYSHLPGRKAWAKMGVLARMAQGYGLHKIDSPRSRLTLAEDEREEQRQIWWSIWKLDTYSNTVASTPFLLDVENMCTFLPSTSIEDFTAGRIGPSSQILLNPGPGYIETLFSAIQLEDAIGGQNLFIVVNSLLREASAYRRRLMLNPSASILDGLAAVANSCSYVRLGLSSSYSHPSRNFMTNETPAAHQQRLETLIQFNV